MENNKPLPSVLMLPIWARMGDEERQKSTTEWMAARAAGLTKQDRKNAREGTQAILDKGGLR